MQNGFQYKKFLNVQLLKLRDFGTISRQFRLYNDKIEDVMTRRGNLEHYDIESEGGNFQHIKLVLCIYLMGLLLALLI